MHAIVLRSLAKKAAIRFRFVRCAIEGKTDDEQRPTAGGQLPSAPRAIRIEEPLSQAKLGHQGPVEGMGPTEV
jgi:hypothetical protein